MSLRDPQRRAFSDADLASVDEDEDEVPFLVLPIYFSLFSFLAARFMLRIPLRTNGATSVTEATRLPDRLPGPPWTRRGTGGTSFGSSSSSSTFSPSALVWPSSASITSAGPIDSTSIASLISLAVVTPLRMNSSSSSSKARGLISRRRTGHSTGWPAERVRSWRGRGYRCWVPTGARWWRCQSTGLPPIWLWSASCAFGSSTSFGVWPSLWALDYSSSMSCRCWRGTPRRPSSFSFTRFLIHLILNNVGV